MSFQGVESRSRVLGVDFSGAMDCGKKIWIAEGAIHGGSLRIERCDPLSEHMRCSARRDVALEALTHFLAGWSDAVVGLDFPFGMPAPLSDGQTWEDAVRGIARFRNAEDFRALHQEHSEKRPDGSRIELKRATDREAGTPFSPYNVRIYSQTYHGVAYVLAPLALSGGASVLPMQRPERGRPWLIEICPASTLRRLGLYGARYKGRGLEAARRRILDGLVRTHRVTLAPGIRDAAIAGRQGDPLDSIVAAFAAWRSLPGLASGPKGPPYDIEGWVYVGA